ncbi:MAG: carbamoyl transferase NodU family protein [Alphaproteobacteria bacterium]|nr:carbamoyl transferase NodU family protein [Alphaproteobacteria bacterium]
MCLKNKQFILSVSFCYHDSCITISDKEKIILHLEAERVFRSKHIRMNSKEEMNNLIEIALNYLDISIDNIEEVFVTKLNNKYKKQDVILGKSFNFIETSHHDNHIGATFPSNFKKCVIVVADGGSEDGTTKVYYKDDNEIKFIEDLDDTILTGKFYGTIAQMVVHPRCSKAHNTYVGKLMGVSSLGREDENIKSKLIKYSKKINQLHFDGCEDLLEKFELHSNYERYWSDEKRINLACTAHNYWVNEFAKHLKRHNEFSRNICITGGCALNIILNSKLIDDKIYDNIYVSPISSDCGQSLGGLLFNYPNIICEYPFLGRGYGEIDEVFNYKQIVSDLIEGNIIAWYQGRSEIGPRSLGHRSFIGLPSSINMHDKLSVKVKKREKYRPVAAIVPLEMCSDYFYQDYESPFMTMCYKAKPITKSLAPAIVHVDGTCRVQTLRYEENPFIYNILLILKEKGEVPMIMNSSLNVDGEPIVDTIDDVKKTFKNSKADVLYINGKRFIK